MAEKAPALKICSEVSLSLGSFCCSFLPMPKPKKLMAKMGVTPVIGAPIPEKIRILFLKEKS